jgi:hypothetical protein
MKTCAHCEETKQFTEFYFYKSTGQHSRLCKPCERAKYRANREQELAKMKEWYVENKDKKSVYNRRKWRDKRVKTV